MQPLTERGRAQNHQYLFKEKSNWQNNAYEITFALKKKKGYVHLYMHVSKYALKKP